MLKPRGRFVRGIAATSRAMAGVSVRAAAMSVVVSAWLGAGCFPDPEDLRPHTTPSGGSTGGGGTTGTGGTPGLGGAGGSAGTLGAAGGRPGAGGATGSGGAGLGGATGVGGHTSTGGATGAGGAAGAGLVLTPDATGWIDKSTNSVGVQGGWYGFSDGIGPNGQTSTGI